jgi:SNF2 family DNA or RNA helicase
LQNSESKDILVTSYDLLKRDMEIYEKLQFYCEIIDEAQYIKNSNTQAAKAVKAVKAGFKLALTGTPIENRLSELWSIFDYLMPGFLYSYQRFRDELELPIVQNQDETAVRRFQKMITPFILRRLKKEVLTDLPDKLEESVYANLEGEQQKLYDAHVKKLQILLGKQSEEEFKNSKIQILSELTRLRQICCDPALIYEDYQDGSAKIDLCMDLIRNAISGNHKILLFSQFTTMLAKLQHELQKENIDCYSLTGATSKENRAKMVEDFNKDDTPVFCISLKAGGTGLNLTSADIVIHFDPWWNLAVQNQATDRAHRIGQKNVVSEYKLIVKGTIEENIMKIQDKKKELAEQVLSGEGMNVGSFSREELLALLR